MNTMLNTCSVTVQTCRFLAPDVDGKTRFYAAGDTVLMDGVVRKDWREAVADDKGKAGRIPYELCVLVSRRDAIRRREIHPEGALRRRNPEDDLPGERDARHLDGLPARRTSNGPDAATSARPSYAPTVNWLLQP